MRIAFRPGDLKGRKDRFCHFFVIFFSSAASASAERHATRWISQKKQKTSSSGAGGKRERCGKQLARNNHFEGEWGAWKAHHRTAVKSGDAWIKASGQKSCRF